MSQWRRKASEYLPELQKIIAARLVDSPMMLWIELNQEFERFCEAGPPFPIDLLRRYWHYAEWCLEHGNPDVFTGAALGFCEHLLDSPQRRTVLRQIMTRKDLTEIRNLLEYHNTPAEVDAYLKELWK